MKLIKCSNIPELNVGKEALARKRRANFVLIINREKKDAIASTVDKSQGNLGN